MAIGCEQAQGPFQESLRRFDSDYGMYDPTGRLLYQRPLPAGATEEIDLSRFGRGVYLLRVSDTEGVRHVPTHIGRVVVE
jgi:hypothetical protein